MSDHWKRIPLVELAEQSRGHSIFSPSGSSMWAFCTGSLIPNLSMPDSAGIDAATGTVAHSVSELWLTSGFKPYHLIDTWEVITRVDDETGEETTFDILIDEDMLYYCGQYVDWCKDLDGKHYVETRVDFSDLTPIPNQGGTADHAVCRPGHLTITDLKFGRGIKVFALNNTQAILYAYGFFREYDWLYDFQTIEIRIAQPRMNHFDTWTITREVLLEWAEWLSARAHEAWDYAAPRVPGAKQCQWCKIKTSCKAFATWVEQIVTGSFDGIDKPVTSEQMEETLFRLSFGEDYKLNPIAVNELDTDHKAAIYRHASMIKKWLDGIGLELYRELQNGKDVPGFKLVKGNDSRSFISQDKAVTHFEFLGLDEDEIKPRVMNSPAQMEQSLLNAGYKRKMLEVLMLGITKKLSGKPTMVPSDDRRQALIMNDDDSFEVLD